MTVKANCWQVKKCGRESGGAKAAELGVCPASTASTTGLNGGERAGRLCWAIAGTLCGSKPQGTFIQKASSCMNCDFYLSVKREEGSHFRLLPVA